MGSRRGLILEFSDFNDGVNPMAGTLSTMLSLGNQGAGVSSAGRSRQMGFLGRLQGFARAARCSDSYVTESR